MSTTVNGVFGTASDSGGSAGTSISVPINTIIPSSGSGVGEGQTIWLFCFHIPNPDPTDKLTGSTYSSLTASDDATATPGSEYELWQPFFPSTPGNQYYEAVAPDAMFGLIIGNL